MMGLLRKCLYILLLIASAARAQGLEIDVVGLFKDEVLLEVNGTQRLLRLGETSPEGISLVSANSREAIINVGAEQMTVNLSTRIGTQFKPVTHATVSIAVNREGQYSSTGSINDHPVSFLVDTGATIVAMNSAQAKALGIDYLDKGKPRRATTAGGVVRSWSVMLDSVQIGGIRVDNVRAAVLEGDFPEKILLGMTFLRNVDIKQSADTMVLRSKL